MKVALLVHAFIEGDAIGNNVRLKLRALQEAGIETRIFALSSEPSLGHVCTTLPFRRLRADPFYTSATIRVLEFGWCTPLTRLVTHAPGTIRSAVYFHGMTPAEFAPGHLRSTAGTTRRQLSSFRRANRVFCASDYSRRVLELSGVAPERITILPLPIDLGPCQRTQRGTAPVHLLWIGRMVPSKGLHDLIEALRLIGPRHAPEWRLRIVTATLHQERSFVEQIQRAIDAAGFRARITFTLDVTDRAELAKLYADSDIVAIPSYHESYCLPLLEALASGCAVVAYDSGAIPEAASGLACLVRCGDPGGLADALLDALRARAQSSVLTQAHGLLALDRFQQFARARTGALTPAGFSQRWNEVLRRLNTEPPFVRQPLLRRIFGGLGASAHRA